MYANAYLIILKFGLYRSMFHNYTYSNFNIYFDIYLLFKEKNTEYPYIFLHISLKILISYNTRSRTTIFCNNL